MYSEYQKKNCFTLSRHQIQNYKSGRKERKKEEEIEANLVILGKRNSDSSTAKDGAWVTTISDDNVVGR